MSGDTRQRILTVANELFIEQGYEGTSLREIADRLDITKAALYYHFRSKDEILETLLTPFDTLLDELLNRLEDARDVEGWAEALTWVVEQIFEYLDFFRLVDRNRHIVELMLVDSKRDHAEMHTRVERAAHRAASSVPQEVRMIAAIGAVTGFDDWAPTLLKEAGPEMLKAELSGLVDEFVACRHEKAALDARSELSRSRDDLIKQRQRYGFGGFIEVGPGRDTNISSSTSDFANSILGAFGLSGIVPTGNSLRRADNFFAANAGGDAYYRLAEDRTLYAAVWIVGMEIAFNHQKESLRISRKNLNRLVCCFTEVEIGTVPQDDGPASIVWHGCQGIEQRQARGGETGAQVETQFSQ